MPGLGGGRGFKVIRALSQGGMADLFLARDDNPVGASRRVVVKRLRLKYLHDREFTEMFLDEARIALALEHPNIVRAYDAGVWQGALYIEFEYLRGIDLARFMGLRPRGQALPLDLALTLARGLCAALDYIHRISLDDGTWMELVHRDVSPHNLFLCRSGTVKLLDFGVAWFAQRTTADTAKGVVKGKVAYMSPEQCRGAAVDRKSDLFSAGVVLYEMTTGRRPFRGHRQSEIARRTIEEPPALPTVMTPGYPPALEALVLEMLAKDPAERPADAAAAAERIEDVAADLGLALGPAVVRRSLAAVPETEAEAAANTRSALMSSAIDRTAVESRPIFDREEPACRVLVVDEEESVHQIVKNRLHDYARVSAYCAAQALDALQSHDFDIVLLDLDLPDQSGFTVLDQVRRGDSSAAVLVLTAVSDMASVVEAMRRGATDYLVKSGDTYDRLEDVVQGVLQRRRMSDRAH